MTLAAERGEKTETRAAQWLSARGLRLVARNVRTRFGEIDLVMEDGGTLVFVEVRYRSRDDFGGAAASVTRAKRTRIERSIRAYLASVPGVGRRDLRADVVAVSGSGRIEWIRNAFEGTL